MPVVQERRRTEKKPGNEMRAKLVFSVRARAKPRPRAGKFSVYTPAPFLAWCDLIRGQALEQLRPQGWYLQETGAVLLHAKFLQKKWRGDADQLLGAVMDALQGAAYLDDCQIHCPMPYASIYVKNLIIITLERPERLPEGVQEWIRQGEARQKGARKGRDMKKIKGGRKCILSKRKLLYQRHTNLT